jgi:hypothetical protein
MPVVILKKPLFPNVHTGFVVFTKLQVMTDFFYERLNNYEYLVIFPWNRSLFWKLIVIDLINKFQKVHYNVADRRLSVS